MLSKPNESCPIILSYVFLLHKAVLVSLRNEPYSVRLNESYWAVLSCGTVNYAVQGGSNFWVCRWNPKMWPFKWKLLSSTFLWYCLLWCTRWSVVTFESYNEILKCDHSNESYWAVLSRGTIYYLLLFILLFIIFVCGIKIKKPET